MSRTVEFEYELEAMGCTLSVFAEIDGGEPARINLANPELAHPGAGPSVESIGATVGEDEIDVDLDAIAISVPTYDMAYNRKMPKWVSLADYLGELAIEKYTENCD